MHNISMMQALSIWSDLEQAYYGDNGFGGDTAEIYAYRLRSSNPSRLLTTEYELEEGRQASISLRELLRVFCKTRHCGALVDGEGFELALARPLLHRCHVQIQRV